MLTDNYSAEKENERERDEKREAEVGRARGQTMKLEEPNFSFSWLSLLL